MEYLLINETRIGEFQEIKTNAIIWEVSSLLRKSTQATVRCSLMYIDENDTVTDCYKNFSVEIPNEVLQSWGADDSVIDNLVLTYSPLFVKRENK
jgi:hypothetical protein